jgi:hypothetical protein
LIAQVHSDDVGALFGKANGVRATLATSGTSYEGNFALEFSRH